MHKCTHYIGYLVLSHMIGRRVATAEETTKATVVTVVAVIAALATAEPHQQLLKR